MIPIWVANFVVANYGTGAVMSVPAHDARDFAFAQKYHLPVKQVIKPDTGSLAKTLKISVDWKKIEEEHAKGVSASAPKMEGGVLAEAFTSDGVLFDSGEFSTLTSLEARAQLTREATRRGIGKGTVNYHLRDWGFSRQRYWGTPIPIVYCTRCDPDRKGIPVPYDQLPVRLPPIDVATVLTGRGEPPLAKVPEFVETTCPRCKGPARRETETMDTFVDSTWYFARYLSPRDDTQPFDKALAKRWLPVDVYVGGPEHAVMHLLYFRFWTRVMKEMGLLEVDEPVKRLVTQGIVNGPDGRKMSKRWGNVISPGAIISRFGADTARMFVMFAGPPENDIDWSDEQVEGQFRFLNRVWRLARAHQHHAGAKLDSAETTGDALAIRRAAHKCLKRVTESMEKLSFNTAIAGIMEACNALQALPDVGPNVPGAWSEAIPFIANCLSPFAPHFADELASMYGITEPLQACAWPEFIPALTIDDTVAYAVQVNGKLRGELVMAVASSEEDVRRAAGALDSVKPHLEGKAIRRVVFVPKRLVNFVVG